MRKIRKPREKVRFVNPGNLILLVESNNIRKILTEYVVALVRIPYDFFGPIHTRVSRVGLR